MARARPTSYRRRRPTAAPRRGEWGPWQEHWGAPYPYTPSAMGRLPPELDYQHNPAAPLPPGFVWLACLCFAWVGRPPDYHGQVRDREHRIRYTVGPPTRAGDPCPQCRAPVRQLRRGTDPYPPIELVDPWAARRRQAVAAAPEIPAPGPVPLPAPPSSVYVAQGPGVAYVRPAPLARWSRFPSMAAERAWVAAQRRAGQLP